MKTPEEIKKGLEYCAVGMCFSKDCPYKKEKHGLKGDWVCRQNVEFDALNYIQQLERVNAELVSKTDKLEAQIPKWISVEERLPEKQGDYIVLYSFGETNVQHFAGVMYFIRYDERPHFENDGLYGLHVTHWISLPDSPKEAGA